MEEAGKESSAFERLLQIIRTLRSPQGCPWDRKQTPDSMKACLLEECYELVEAVSEGKQGAVCEECGDLIFLVLFLANLYQEQDRFTVADALNSISDKMVSRHPHVFEEVHVDGVDDVLRNWERIKAAEKDKQSRTSALDGVPAALPALSRAHSIQTKAARVGFDWARTADTLHKISEEIAELEAELETADPARMEDELGDLLFSLVNLARHLKINPETALIKTILKFTHRFHFVEQQLVAQGRSLAEADLSEMDNLWEEAKRLKV